jgi:hypothetical protein
MYARNGKRQKIGVVVAILNDYMEGDYTYSIGWSKCNRKDEFDRDLGVNIATMRALIAASKDTVLFTHKDKPIPRAVRKTIDIVNQRASRYFKRNYH